jgi:alkylation response protein AidB-like acyl-CoA dehydrogenase
MALNPLVDSRDVRFALYEVMEAEKMIQFDKYSGFDKDTFDSMLELAESIAVEQLYPTFADGDKQGCHHDGATNKVTIPECYKPALTAFYEAGFGGMDVHEEWGGMGVPQVVTWACNEYLCAANFPLMMYPGLTHGAAELVEAFGTEEQKHMYLAKMYNGTWGGTMCLTEPDAGSDVGALKTKAVKNSDGTYKITGQQIFISCGDNEYFENMVHPVLARIEGDPGGTKGISIFLVPKFRVKPDGSCGEFNDVICSGIEHKMGIKGSATCTLNFGDSGKCIGWLLGEERQGMKIMFKMMNYARMGVGLQGQATASAAYMHAVTYTKNRIQGVHVTQMLNPEAKGVNIIQHPDVKRMLLWMKSYVEAQRMMIYYLYKNYELQQLTSGDEAKEAQALVEIITPIAKAGCTDMAVEITSMATQCYGGYGYCGDYPVEQMMRNSKITAIYEGTNGIQSMDLTMRKILMNKDQYNYSVLKSRIQQAIDKAKGVVDDKYIDVVKRGVQKLDEVVEMLKGQMAGGKFLHLFASATSLQQAMYMLVIAWMHLWSLTISQPKMKALVGDKKGADRDQLLKDNFEAAFYTGKVLASQFYLGQEFYKYFGRIEALLSDESAVIKASDEIFTGALEG